MNKIVLAGAALTMAAAVPALAQRGDRPAGPLTRSAVEARVEARFAAVDSDRDGFVTAAEARARAEAGRSARRDRAFARLDADGDGAISRAEFDASPRRGHARSDRRGDRRGAQRGAMAARFGAHGFAAMDSDKDGRVSRAEASARALAMFDRADADRDGTVTADERRAAREAFRGHRRQRRGG